MNRLVLRLELRRSLGSTVGLAVVGALYVVIVGLMYPFFQRNTDLLAQYLDHFPKGLLSAFGMSGNLASPGVFFTTYIGIALWPILAAIAVSIVSTRVLAADVESGWHEIVLGTPLTRSGLAAVSILTQALVLLALTAAVVVAFVITGRLVGAPFGIATFALAALVCYAFACAVAGVTSLIAVLTLRRGQAAGAMAAILLLMYLGNVVAQLQPNLGWLADISAFKYLTLTSVIDQGASAVRPLLVFGGAAALGWGGALLVFRRRDLLA